MMGKQSKAQSQLFYYGLSLEDRIPPNHLLRKIKGVLNLDFVYDEVKACYGTNGNVSVPPPVLIKMMLLLFLYNVRSERELMETIPYRLDWLWFLDYDFDSDLPDHSVLSKARSRWGLEVFDTLFTRVVWQCLQAGLIDGQKLHMDGSLIDAHASNNSVVKGNPEMIARLKELLRDEMSKLDEPGEQTRTQKYYTPQNKSMVSTTDSDAAIVRQGKGKPKVRYKTHRAIDDQCGVITAVETTPGDVEENARQMSLIDQHEKRTQCCVDTVVADTQYGTADNFSKCYQRGIKSHMADLLIPQLKKGRRAGIFSYHDFIYNPQTDTYTCPAGEILIRRKDKKIHKAYEYACDRSLCRVCTIRDQCTRAKKGAPRTIKRHYEQDAIDAGRKQSHSLAAKRDRQRRKWLMEGSFADAANLHGFKRARWRRLWRQQIQDLLIAIVQNLRKLVRYLHKPGKAGTAALKRSYLLIKCLFRILLSSKVYFIAAQKEKWQLI